jgi:glycosyltransferase involved in cell wall biosynthesis
VKFVHEVNRLHVALLSHEYPPFIYGGVGSFLENLAQGLLRMGAEVTVITGYPVPQREFKKFKVGEEQTESGVNIIRFPYPNISPRQLWFQICNLPKLSEVIRGVDADVIHGQSGCSFPAILALQKIAPTVVTFHVNPKVLRDLTIHSIGRGGVFSDFLTYVIGYPEWKYTHREEFFRSDSAIAVSQTLMDEMKKDFGEKKKGEFRYVYNGVDVEGLQSRQSGSPSKNENENQTIVFGGRLYWSKGIFQLLELANLLQKKGANWKIMIYGTGPLYYIAKKRIANLGLKNVFLFGHVTSLEFIEAVKESTFVVIPSYNEACPMVLLECMCLGKIPFMFNLPFAREFTENGKYGILANSVDDMATRIESTYRTVDLETMGKEIKRFANKKYDITKVASEYLKIYRKLAN